jgi:hypothetical protein
VAVNVSPVNYDGLGTFAGYLYKQFSISNRPTSRATHLREAM